MSRPSATAEAQWSRFVGALALQLIVACAVLLGGWSLYGKISATSQAVERLNSAAPIGVRWND